MIKVSVIIPVYNTELYVEEAVRSIMNQTLQELEIIIINDGSTDQSLSIIEKLANEDNRIRLFSQANKGLSTSRNIGLEQANGKYIYYMDSDDILSPEALTLCYNKCEQNNLDFVFFDATVFYDNKTRALPYDYNRTKQLNDQIYRGLELLSIMLDKRLYRSSVCLNLISHKFIKESHLYFRPDIIHEDELYSFQLYALAKSVSFIQKAFYKRRVREDSIMTRQFSFFNIRSYFTVLDSIRTYPIDKNCFTEQTIKKLISYIINPVIYNASSLSVRERLITLYICLAKHFVSYIRIKNLCILLFPWLIKAKAIIKKKQNE